VSKLLQSRGYSAELRKDMQGKERMVRGQVEVEVEESIFYS
jgi:hypothetical protein